MEREAPRRPPQLAIVVAARTLGLDALAVPVLRALRAAGCRTIVLRGPALRRRLHGDGSLRAYGDVDLLVAPADLERAGATLEELGFEMGFDHRDHPGAAEPHAQEWGRPGGPRVVDLHWRIPGVEAPPQRAWEILSARTEAIGLGGELVESLCPDGIALLVAVHASHHGRAYPKSLQDLERALERLDGDAWGGAARLARDLDATDAFGAGLRLLPEGERLASALGLPEVRSPERRLLAGEQPAGSVGLLRLVESARWRDRLRTLRHALLPSRAYMRAMSPLARRGRAGLALAYVARAGRRTVQLPAAVRAVRASRTGSPASRSSAAAAAAASASTTDGAAASPSGGSTE